MKVTERMVADATARVRALSSTHKQFAQRLDVALKSGDARRVTEINGYLSKLRDQYIKAQKHLASLELWAAQVDLSVAQDRVQRAKAAHKGFIKIKGKTMSELDDHSHNIDRLFDRMDTTSAAQREPGGEISAAAQMEMKSILKELDEPGTGSLLFLSEMYKAGRSNFVAESDLIN